MSHYEVRLIQNVSNVQVFSDVFNASYCCFWAEYLFQYHKLVLCYDTVILLSNEIEEDSHGAKAVH